MVDLMKGSWEQVPWREIRKGIDQAVIALGAEQMSVTIGAVHNGADIRPHHHPNEQVAIILDGSCDYHINDTIHKLKKGDWLVIPPDQMHYIHVYESDVPCLILEIFAPCRPSYVSDYLNFLSANSTETDKEGREQ